MLWVLRSVLLVSVVVFVVEAHSNHIGVAETHMDHHGKRFSVHLPITVDLSRRS